MSDPAADTKGTGWRISGRSGKRWFRIEKGSPEYNEWIKFYRNMGKGDLAAVIEKMGFSFVFGPSPTQHGSAQMMFLNQQQQDASA